ncbi:hypothetical protein N7B40_001406 [Salmonella enterica]|nr:hypothetical protein [Salmonella enterica]EGS8488538.1 hypothetical protein [Salmonella enterica subsp. enterica serovar Panama]QVC97202.1 hypothetical protein JYN09_03850 [Salmonella enterica subsp. enterica serovar Newport]EEP7187799.1 hypothetical protein [Salmonella enterica]EFR6994778.1 hypothetical protein [Salmonella enterica]
MAGTFFFAHAPRNFTDHHQFIAALVEFELIYSVHCFNPFPSCLMEIFTLFISTLATITATLLPEISVKNPLPRRWNKFVIAQLFLRFT